MLGVYSIKPLNLSLFKYLKKNLKIWNLRDWFITDYAFINVPIWWGFFLCYLKVQ